jgi:hypothetical protein
MYDLKIRKMIGSFIFVLAICFLFLSVFEIINKSEHINEYQYCLNEYETAPIASEQYLLDCKNTASQGLGITILQNKPNITTSQYLYIYLKGLINVLIAVTLLIIGQILYSVNIKNPEKKILKKKTTPIVVKRKKRRK